VNKSTRYGGAELEGQNGVCHGYEIYFVQDCNKMAGPTHHYGRQRDWLDYQGILTPTSGLIWFG
jgi:hypothetical protein